MGLKKEAKVQKAFLQWLKLQHPEVRDYVVKIDNEGKRSYGGHAIAKSLGLHAGASDLLIAYPYQGYAGLWLEVKPEDWKPYQTAKKTLERQMEFLDKMRGAGYMAELGAGVDECIRIAQTYLKGK
jgi:hypothetical protein